MTRHYAQKLMHRKVTLPIIESTMSPLEMIDRLSFITSLIPTSQHLWLDLLHRLPSCCTMSKVTTDDQPDQRLFTKEVVATASLDYTLYHDDAALSFCWL